MRFEIGCTGAREYETYRTIPQNWFDFGYFIAISNLLWLWIQITLPIHLLDLRPAPMTLSCIVSGNGTDTL
jgi:hypothetical protein